MQSLSLQDAAYVGRCSDLTTAALAACEGTCKNPLARPALIQEVAMQSTNMLKLADVRRLSP